MEQTKNINRCEICSREELEQFVSIYERFKQIIKRPDQNTSDFSYEQTKLADDIKDFWPVIERIARSLDISLQSNLRLVKKLIFGDTITVPVSGGKKVTIIRPEGDLDSFMICGFMHSGENFIYSAVQQLHWPERDLDCLMTNLCKYFGLKREDFIAEGIAKCKPCTEDEFLRFKSIHKRLNFLIEHQSKTAKSAYLHKQTEVFEDIKDFWPRLNQISRLLNAPLEIGLEGFKVAIFGSKHLSKIDADLICSKRLYQGMLRDEAIATEKDRMKWIAKENLDEVMAGLSKHFKKTGQPEEELHLTIDEECSEVRYKGKSYLVTPRQVEFLTKLNETPGVWIPGPQLKKRYDERLDKVKKSLPKPILKLIESHTRNGYRLVRSP